ncbi:hypothetical protein ABB29_09635 [Pseudoxanthomonas dokdonensis]|uniref:DUF1579 domain-containing protein n=2 Tax=Pseudoxanthomonas dokdonensis TaxID=344882 RepID=A0A0R0CHM7_9GAMM|nr:hypothetical protein ABB29_09635 [Pseudoxanthomonas dokdonensis]
MRRLRAVVLYSLLSAVTASLLLAKAGQAQALPSPADPARQAAMDAWQAAATAGAQHRQLAEHFVGQWQATLNATGEAILGGRQIRTVYTGSMMGAPFEGISLSGYDNVSRQYTSVWQDNMSTGSYLTEGDYDPASRSYQYRGQWPDPLQAGTLVQVRETLRVVDADHHVLDMHETRAGKEVHVMRIEFTRIR